MNRIVDIIDLICGEQSIEQRKQLITEIPTSKGLYMLLDHYNWDDGFQVPLAISNHSACDLAIAQRMYWLADADWYLSPDIDINRYNKDHHHFSMLIRERLLAGFYRVGDISHSEGFSRVSIHLFKKNLTPEVLYLPVIAKEYGD